MCSIDRAAWRLLLAAICAPLAYSAGSAACAECHRDIFESYRRTPMALSSGEAGRDAVETFGKASFTHAASGFHYRVSQAGGSFQLEFARKGDAALGGKKLLRYYVGSGAVARSYLLADDGFLYEAPVAYYTAGRNWGLAPGYEQYAYPYVTRPVSPPCLNCHASFLDVVRGTQNRFGAPPFGEGGIACERCHGPGEAHVAKMRAGETSGGAAIVNPAKLDPERRDSVCEQCHLSGEVRVTRAGSAWSTYRPGDRLSDSVAVFVRAGTVPGMRVNSHFEKLAQSACKRASGDRLWCGSCHDPHAAPDAAQRAAWFRGKCLACHASKGCTESAAVRARNQNDCIACHMPRSPVTDAQHVVYTDHSIPRRPRGTQAGPAAEADLVPFEGTAVSARDTALAYAIAAGHTTPAAFRARALRLLEQSERAAPNDSEVLLYLAEMYRNAGREAEAEPLYRRAMQLDPGQVTASVGLGGILFERGEFARAIALWQDALAKNGGLVLVGTNLAMAQWRTGDVRAAGATLRRIIDLSPGFAPARELLRRLETQGR